MAEKLNSFASRLSQGTPKGLGLGVKVLVGASAVAYGVYRSMFTGRAARVRDDDRPRELLSLLQWKAVTVRSCSIESVASTKIPFIVKDCTSGRKDGGATNRTIAIKRYP